MKIESDIGLESPQSSLEMAAMKAEDIPPSSVAFEDTPENLVNVPVSREVEADKDDHTTDVVLGCQVCGETFPCQWDNIFRKHMLVKHNFEIRDDKYFEESKVYQVGVRRCKKCRILVSSNFEDHRKTCLPLLSVECAFENVISKSKALGHISCGLCNFTKTFGMRHELKRHFEEKHEEISSKMIFDPEFRCSKCLKRFDETMAFSKHCATCADNRPRTETVVELAKSLLFCDLCNEKHTCIDETLSCFRAKNIHRCVFCGAAFKDKALFYQHLFTYHRLKLEAKAVLPCPMCIGTEPDTVKNATQHVVSAHFGPALASNGGQQLDNFVCTTVEVNPEPEYSIW